MIDHVFLDLLDEHQVIENCCSKDFFTDNLVICS